MKTIKRYRQDTVGGGRPRCEIWPVPPVPFVENDKVDMEALDSLVDFYADAGADGLFILAYSGEGLELRQEQRIAVCQRMVQRSAKQMPVVAGGNFIGSLSQQIDHMKGVADAGPDAVVIFLSTLPRPEHLVDDLLEIARSLTDVPLGIYECPVPEHRLLNVEDVRTLAESGRFVFMKETSRDRQQHRAKIEAAAGSPLTVYQANLAQLPNSIEDGCLGFCGIIASLFPELINAYCNDPTISPHERAVLFDSLREVLAQMASRCYPASLKYLLSLRGVPSSTYSLMVGADELDENDCRVLKESLKNLDVMLARKGIPKPKMLSKLQGNMNHAVK